MKELTTVCLSRLLLVLFLMNMGCITYREGQLQPITHWPLEAKSVKPSISLVMSGKAFDNGQERDVTATELVHYARTMAVRAYQDSRLFSDVKIGTADTDIRAEINIVDRGEGNSVMPYVSGLTMTLIPCTGRDTYTLSTTLTDSHGTSLSTFQKQETNTFWIQLFLVFIMPFRSADEDIVYDLNRATIQDARAKGHL